MPFITTHRILEAYANYEYFGLMVYGPLRHGKSSFAIQVLAEVYGILKNPGWKTSLYRPLDEWATWVMKETTPDWDAWKTWMVFPPEEFVTKVREQSSKQRPLLVWDDAGFWLSHYSYTNPFIQKVAEYLNVVATDWASIVFTTPDPRWCITHVRNLPGGHTGRVSKPGGNQYQRDNRYIIAYEGWLAPDLVKKGVRTVYKDDFTIMLPDKVFKEYDAYRRSYTEQSKNRLFETLDSIRKAHGDETAERYRREMEEKTGLELSG